MNPPLLQQDTRYFPCGNGTSARRQRPWQLSA